jgi:predicted cupin superfamily sugar epimerase
MLDLAQATLMHRPLTAADIIRLLELKPHPEGGHFRETFRDARLDQSQEMTMAAMQIAGRCFK